MEFSFVFYIFAIRNGLKSMQIEHKKDLQTNVNILGHLEKISYLYKNRNEDGSWEILDKWAVRNAYALNCVMKTNGSTFYIIVA